MTLAAGAVQTRRVSRLGPVGLVLYNLVYWPYLFVSCEPCADMTAGLA